MKAFLMIAASFLSLLTSTVMADNQSSASTSASSKSSATTKTSSAHSAKHEPAKDKPATTPAPTGKSSNDRLELDTTIVSGTRELPKVLYIVPWKKADVGNLPGQPFNTLLDEALKPVDREVFRREVDYYKAISNKDQPGKGFAGARNGAQSAPQSQSK